MVTNNDIASLLFGSKKNPSRTQWGTVRTPNVAGRVGVMLNGSVVTSCASTCQCSVGERVLVELSGVPTVIGKKV